MPAERDLSIYAGDSYFHELRLKDNSNTAINITSRSYSGTMKIARSAEEVIATFTTSITDGANGVVLFSLESNTTANIVSGEYVYDFEETNGTVVTTLLTGNAIVEAEVG